MLRLGYILGTSYTGRIWWIDIFFKLLQVTSMFWSNVHTGSCIGYNCVALMAEINSFFLHSRKLLQMSEIGFNHWFYKLVTYLNLFSFVSCRGFSICRIFYGMYIEPSRVPRLFYICLSMSMVVMSVINVILFWRLFKSDILKPQKQQPKLNGNHNSFYRKDEWLVWFFFSLLVWFFEKYQFLYKHVMLFDTSCLLYIYIFTGNALQTQITNVLSV